MAEPPTAYGPPAGDETFSGAQTYSQQPYAPLFDQQSYSADTRGPYTAERGYGIPQQPASYEDDARRPGQLTRPATPPPPPAGDNAAEDEGGRRVPLLLIAAIVGLVLVGVGVWTKWPRDESSASPQSSVPAALAPESVDPTGLPTDVPSLLPSVPTDSPTPGTSATTRKPGTTTTTKKPTPTTKAPQPPPGSPGSSPPTTSPSASASESPSPDQG
jgi:hypothetical protein